MNLNEAYKAGYEDATEDMNKSVVVMLSAIVLMQGGETFIPFDAVKQLGERPKIDIDMRPDGSVNIKVEPA